MQEKIKTIHVYLSEEDTQTVIDADPPQAKINRLALCYLWFLGVFFSLIPLCAIILSTVLPPYAAVVTKTLTITFSLHPTGGQGRLYTLPAISKTEQETVPATGESLLLATQAVGVITFFNGQFTRQIVPAGTKLTGKDGIGVVTQEEAIIPPATPTTPPTYGNTSVTAYSAISGTSGNISAHDIDQECCGSSILAENLDSFSGGKNAIDVTVVQQRDITNAANTLKEHLSQEANNTAEQELTEGLQLFPLACTNTTSANKNAGDQAQTISVTATTTCTPFAFSRAEVQQHATSILASFVPRTDRIIRVTLLLVSETLRNRQPETGTVTLVVTAYLTPIRYASVRFVR